MKKLLLSLLFLPGLAFAQTIPQPLETNQTQIDSTGIATGNGTVSAGTQRVTVASDSTGSLTCNLGTISTVATEATLSSILTELGQKTEPANTQIVGDGSGALTVDGTVAATQSGTWTLGANSGVDIGDVTVNNTTSTPVFIQHNTTSVGTGRKVVATAGTREALASSTTCKWVLITAETDNTGLVVVGGSSVVAALATRQGNPLYAGDTVVIPVDNLADLQLDSTVSGDGVTYTYGQ